MPTTPIRMLMLDVLKPHKPNIIDFAQKIASLKGIDNVSIIVEEVDEKTESVRVSITGKHIRHESLQKTIKSLGGIIHSVDKVSAGRKAV